MDRLKIAAVILTVMSALLFSCATTQSDSPNKNKLLVSHYKMGMSKINEQDFQAAQVEFKKALEIDPNDKETLNALGLTCLHFQDNKCAIDTFKKAIHSDSNYSEAHNNLGITYARLGQWEDSIQCFKKALENQFYEKPDRAYNNLGYSFYRVGKLREALNAFNESLKRNVKSSSSYMGMALVLNAMGRYGEASERLMQALGTDSYFRGDVAKAREEFEKRKRTGNDYERRDNSDLLDILNY
ncbi:tetratricopeptide repeat protein [Candidatus Magnetomonas plexicatena]|uniref:tetratricopeptide repeat protein n=1 Tax=Candidatus Magnetomonas plexicatena TaxID=2552947 RepID=UPI0011035F6D|nr:tetratricopeptide repeat protein [Nitrospirales bacterium LBB_01]